MKAYASGNWVVKEGKEAEFIKQWGAWLESSRDHDRGLEWAKLLRSADDPHRFVSLSQWESEQARKDWMATDRFRTTLAGLRTLTDEFVGGSYEEAVAVQGQTAMAGMIGVA
jgi:heme-degrading monooxygenase HmoA